MKKSRDVTINSKRAIFVLHRCVFGFVQSLYPFNATMKRNRPNHCPIIRITATSTEEHVVEAGEKLTEVHALLSAIAAELQNEDPAQFWRAFSPGAKHWP